VEHVLCFLSREKLGKCLRSLETGAEFLRFKFKLAPRRKLLLSSRDWANIRPAFFSAEVAV
jgi:hypothetical protein